MNEQDRSIDHSRKATRTLVALAAVALCSVLPYGLSWLRRSGELPSDGAVIGVVLAYYCFLAGLLLWPLAVLELWNLKGAWRQALNLGVGAYFATLAMLFLWDAAHSPTW